MSDDLDKFSEPDVSSTASQDAMPGPARSAHHGVSPETLAAARRVMSRFAVGADRPSPETEAS